MKKCWRFGMSGAALRLMRSVAFGFACLVMSAGLAPAIAQSDANPASPQDWAPGVSVSPSDGWAVQSQPADTDGSQAQPSPQGSEAIDKAREALKPTISGPGLEIVAKLTDDDRTITSDLIWRIYSGDGAPDGAPKMLSTHKNSTLEVSLDPGQYLVNVTYGRAHLTKRIKVNAGPITRDVFVLNAGGLRLTAYAGEKQVPKETVLFDIYEAETDQSGQRRLVIGNLRPDVIIRLNAGIYYIKSVYGDANASVESEVSVEAGKLTEIAMAHAAATVTLALVNRPGGDALPATRWTISTPDGDVVTRSVGALPTHILAPGAYRATAQNSGKEFVREFTVEDNQKTRIEVVVQ